MVDRKELISRGLKDAKWMWNHILDVVRANEKFKLMTDRERIDFINENPRCAEFHKNFSIISRYMVCHGQYKPRAFRRYLELCALTKPSREKNSEEQWRRLQAKYVRFLYEEYNPHYNTKKANEIEQEIFAKLTEEFKNFRSEYDDMEKKIKEERVQHAKEYQDEFVEMLNTDVKEGPALDELLEKLRVLHNIDMHNKLMKELYDTFHNVKKNYVLPVIEGMGLREDLHDKDMLFDPHTGQRVQ